MDRGEFLRMSTAPEARFCAWSIRPRSGPILAMFGMALVDAVRHGAKAYSQAVRVSEEHALEQIWWGFDAERSRPTDDPKQIPDLNSGLSLAK